jgi:hypothetical protein
MKISDSNDYSLDFYFLLDYLIHKGIGRSLKTFL